MEASTTPRPHDCFFCDAGQAERLIATVVERTVERSVKQTLLQLGIDADQPIEFQRDMQYLRGWRESSKEVRGKVATAVVTAIATAALMLGVLGFRYWVESGPRHGRDVPSQTPHG